MTPPSRVQRSPVGKPELTNSAVAAGPSPAERLDSETLAVDLAHHGIVSVTVTVFEWGGYRYTNAGDAIAAAKRSRLA